MPVAAPTGSAVVNVAGLATAYLKGPATSSTPDVWVVLGTTRDGVHITPDGYFLEVKNDENGGEAGPPVEIQYMGETARIRLELTKYDAAKAEMLEARLSGVGAPGATPAAGGDITSGSVASPIPVSLVAPAGTLMFASGGVWQLGLGFSGVAKYGTDPTAATAATGRLYMRAIPRHGIEINKGTKFSTFIVEFECHKDSSGNLWTPWKVPTGA